MADRILDALYNQLKIILLSREPQLAHLFANFCTQIFRKLRVMFEGELNSPHAGVPVDRDKVVALAQQLDCVGR